MRENAGKLEGGRREVKPANDIQVTKILGDRVDGWNQVENDRRSIRTLGAVEWGLVRKWR
ncbi:MAG: hypothetical protein ACI9U2_004681 [Bradymonadia bacterium]|jgi:hypothetical protein